MNLMQWNLNQLKKWSAALLMLPLLSSHHHLRELQSSPALGPAPLDHRWVVEMKRPLLAQEQQRLQDQKIAIEALDPNPRAQGYFARTYLLKGVRLEQLRRWSSQQQLPIKDIEPVFAAKMAGIIPATHSSNFKFKQDLLFPLQWYLQQQGQQLSKLRPNGTLKYLSGDLSQDSGWTQAIHAAEKQLQRSPEVAVIDMGVDWNHPELSNSILKNTAECDAQGNIQDDQLDRDDNGLKGDCLGWNFTATNMYDARRPIDETGHGTHVAGIISAAHNQLGVSGISEKILLLPLKVTGPVDEDEQARQQIQPLTDRIAKAILYATHRKVDVINLSMGWTKAMDTKYLREALNYAQAQGVLIVAAAGNSKNNAIILPCSHYEVICVGASTIDGNLADFSNFGGEVDVLAPGDEIVSTIPQKNISLQLNLQGYDIRSGTSFATPQVSALAALLKGINPEQSSDEIIHYILASAQPAKQPHQVNRGVINFKKAFELQQQDQNIDQEQQQEQEQEQERTPTIKHWSNDSKGPIVPIFKNLSLQLYQRESLAVSFPLLFKNFGNQTVEKLNIKVRSLSKALKLEQRWEWEQWEPKAIRKMELNGSVVDLNDHNMVVLEVEVQYVSPANQVVRFEQELRLSFDFLKSQATEIKKFTFQSDTLPLGTVKEGRASPFIQSVDPLFPEDLKQQEFFLPRRLDAVGLELKFFRTGEVSIDQIPGAITLKDATELLEIIRLDANRDGKNDYMIRSLHCEKPCSGTERKRYLQYSFWDANLEPLYHTVGYSQWRFLPSLVNIDGATQRFHSLNHPQLGIITVPYFIQTLPIPANQQLLKPFELLDTSIKPRLIRLYPKVLTTSLSAENPLQVDLQTEILGQQQLLPKIASTQDQKMPAQVSLVTTLSMNQEEFAAGLQRLLVADSTGIFARYFIAHMKSGIVEKWEPIAGQWMFQQWTHRPTFSIGTGPVADHFFSQPSGQHLQLATLTSEAKAESFDLALPPEQDTIQSHLASFANSEQGVHFSFMQTNGELLILRGDHLAHHDSARDDWEAMAGSELSIFKQRLNKFSFLPNYVFKNTFYPLTVQSQKDGAISPALYVDETDVQQYLVSVTTLNADLGKLVSPIGLSLFVPPICKSLNPTKLDREGSAPFALSILCWIRGEWEMHYLPLTTN